MAKEVKLIAFKKSIRIHQYLDDWLVRARSHQICLQHTKTLVALCQDLGWLVTFKKSELEPKQVFDFVGYQFNLKEGKVRPTLDRWQTLKTKTRKLSGPATDVPHRVINSNRKAGPPRPTPCETHIMTPQTKLEGPRITRKGDTSPQVPPPACNMVAGGKQYAPRSTISPSKTCSAIVYRCIKRRLGRSLK